MNEIQQLEEQILYHNQKYWNENKPEISDSEYDTLVNRLLEIDPNNNIPFMIPATNRSGPKIKHTEAMLSLDKVYSVQDTIKWMNKVARSDEEEFIIEPKFDGIAGKFKNSILSTRGDGHTGEDITDKINILNFYGILHSRLQYEKLKQAQTYINNVLGELIIFKSVFEKNQHRLVRKDGSVYKLPRTAVYGILSLDENFEQYDGLITFVQYGCVSTKLKLKDINVGRLEMIKTGIISSDYPIDGIVVKLSDAAYSHSLGYTSHHPKGQIALKLGNPQGKTVLEDIEISSGKGCLTPVGIVKPVVIENTTNTRISLHNMKYIIDKDIAIGDEIIVEKCGEIIPQYLSTVHRPANRQKIEIKFCPECGSDAEYISPNTICSNPYCIGMLSKRIEDSLRRLGIEYIGASAINKLINIGVDTVYNILIVDRETVLSLPGFKDRSADNLLNEISKIINRPIDDWRILSSLNIPGIGERMSQMILTYYTLDDLMTVTESDLVKLDNVGPKRASLIVQGLQQNSDIINQMKSLFTTINDSKSLITPTTVGKICFTGKCKTYSRKELQKLAESKGFEFSKSVKKDLILLVTDDVNKSGNKINDAKKYGIEIITYEEFFNRML